MNTRLPFTKVLRASLRLRLLLLLLLASNLGSLSQAPPPVRGGSVGYDPTLLSNLKWRSIGPNRGGRSVTAAGSSSRPFEYYFGATGGGLWKTTDGGVTWKPVTDGQILSSSVGAVAVSESDPDVVYIGMGETQLRGNIMQGDGVYKSLDAGKTWTHVGLVDTQAIARVRIHPTNPALVYVAAIGHPYGPNAQRGVFRSKDGGKTWERVLFRSNRAGAVDLCFNPANSQILFAAIWEVYRTPWILWSGGPDSGLFKSTDGGDTWVEITRNPGLPKGIIGKIGVSVSGADSNRVYAIIEAGDGGVFRSDDGGATWTRINEDRMLRQRAFYFTRIYADPKDRDTVYAVNIRIYKSTDGGKTFKIVAAPHGDFHDLWIDPNNPNRMINTNDGGADVSINGGETWTGQDYPTAQLYHVATTKDFPYHVCGAQQDNSTVCVPSDKGLNFRNPRAPVGEWMYPVGGGESGYVAPHPKNPNVFYAGDQGGVLTRYDRSTGHIRNIQVYPLAFSGEPASGLKERWQWTFPIVFSPHDSNILYTSSQHLWKTTNEGQSWKRISPDLTRADPKTLGDSGGPITKDQNGPEIYGTIFTIAPSKHDPSTIWTGSDDGLVYITPDDGKTWENITPHDLPEFSRISLIETSPHDLGTAYLAAKRYQLDDRTPYIFRTNDYGKTWTKIVNGIRSDDFVHAVREDPKRPGLLYAGAEHGVWVSFDAGKNWQSLSLNLPDTQVPDLVVVENDLVIATHGRSFYILDDIGLLRQITPEVARAAVHLFQPRDAVRRVYDAAIDYYLERQAEKVTIEILDSKGQAIRIFTATPEDDKKPDLGPQPVTGSVFLRPPTTKAGTNRFIWDLRYPGARSFPGMILWAGREHLGPLVVPGTYHVRLTANGQTQTQTLRVVKDPRLTNVTQADLEEQFVLAMRIRDKTSEANEAVILIRKLQEQIKDRLEKTKNPRIAAVAESLTRNLGEVEAELYQVRNQTFLDPLNFPIKLNDKLSGLRDIIETGDARPPDQAYAVFKELSAQLQVLLNRLNDRLKTDLVELNKLLVEQTLEAVQVQDQCK